MSDSPKFEVIDRRKYKAEEEEREAAQTPAPAPAPAAVPPPEPVKEEPRVGPQLVTESGREDALAGEELAMEPELPPAPTAEETREQKFAYDASAQRLEDLVRAQNPGVGPQPAVTFDHLVNQLYVSAMIQMGAGTQEGQRPRVDILGAKQTIDLMGVLPEKTKGNLTEAEDRTLQAVLYEVRMAFLELTNMISLQSMQPPAPPPGKR
jgi:type IV secretory pathway VirB10-like protein